MTDSVRALLRCDAPIVLVEAPAGCGKTHEAAKLALDVAPTLERGRHILLLAHTNAAKEEFARRTKGSGVVVSTIDSFATHLLSHYTSALGLPTSLERHLGKRGEGVPFEQLAKRALELLQRAPTLARLLGAKYPLIIGDEHQDASVAQHELLTTLARAQGSRLRLFGDPMQAIFESKDSIGWTAIESCADELCALTTPQRWRDNPALGEWILSARAELASGRPLRLKGAPSTVEVLLCQRTDGSSYRTRDVRTIASPALQFVKRAGQASFSILTFPNESTMTIESAVQRLGVGINEGADYEKAYELLETATAAESRPHLTALQLLDSLRASSVGISAADYKRLKSTLSPEAIHRPPTGRLSAFMQVLEPIYASGAISGLPVACRQVLRLKAKKFRLRMPLAFRLLASLNKEDPIAVQDELSASIAARKTLARKPTRTVSTIHKAKGLEFQHVLIAYCGKSHFPDSEQGRRRLYVGLSRATSSLSFHVPAKHPTPLLELR